jgi:hypothetical protein
MLAKGQRLLIYDGTTRKGEGPLRAAWATGAKLYRAMGRVDRILGAQSWDQALAWLLQEGQTLREQGATIDEVQFWGHGKWGTVYIASDTLSVDNLRAGHVHHAQFVKLKQYLAPEGRALVWFRTCETFGAVAGQGFAKELTTLLGARAAGHTHVIGVLQSGLYGLYPGHTPHWDPREGIAKGTPDDPREALDSSSRAPHTLHFMNGQIPKAWFAG